MFTVTTVLMSTLQPRKRDFRFAPTSGRVSPGEDFSCLIRWLFPFKHIEFLKFKILLVFTTH
jgi:hypothetical protein